MDTTERGGQGGEKRPKDGEFTDFSNENQIYKSGKNNLLDFLKFSFLETD